MRKCPKCNREIENNSTYCEYCGCKIKKTNPLWIIIASLVLGLGIGMLINPFKTGSGQSRGVLASLNEGFQLSNMSLSEQINQKYEAFEEQYGLDEEKVGPLWEQAQVIRDYATDLINYTEALKKDLVQDDATLTSNDTIRNGRKNYAIDLASLKSDRAVHLEQGKVIDLSLKMDRFRREVLKAIGDYNEGRIGLDYGEKQWSDFLNRQTLSEDIAMLSKIVSEVQTAELGAISELMSSIHAADFTFDEISAKVFAESGYLLSGQTYRAQAMVTAWKNSQLTARVKLDGGAEKEYVSNAQGVIPLEWNCGVGSHTYTGIIDMLNPSSNQMEEYPFQGSFVVAPPAVSVSATKMNVVYRGINNPIAVGGGVGGEISATSSSGSMTRLGNGIYNLCPGEANEVTVSISSNGSSLGSMKFRVKDLPRPTALIRNVVNGQASKSALQAAGRVEAEMKDFDFDGVHYDVIGYTFLYKTKGGTTKEAKSKSGSFTDEIRTAISQSNVGDMLVFTAIQVRGNDGKTKTLESDICVMIK